VEGWTTILTAFCVNWCAAHCVIYRRIKAPTLAELACFECGCGPTDWTPSCFCPGTWADLQLHVKWVFESLLMVHLLTLSATLNVQRGVVKWWWIAEDAQRRGYGIIWDGVGCLRRVWKIFSVDTYILWESRDTAVALHSPGAAVRTVTTQCWPRCTVRICRLSTLQWYWGLNSNNCPGRGAFKFIVSLSAFTTVHCTKAGRHWCVKCINSFKPLRPGQQLVFKPQLQLCCGPSITYSSLYKVFVFADPLLISCLLSAGDDVRCHRSKHS
jgi:hypothetical protein